MKIRLFDKFDQRETVCILDGVSEVIGETIFFEDGTEETEYLDNDTDYEILE